MYVSVYGREEKKKLNERSEKKKKKRLMQKLCVYVCLIEIAYIGEHK